MGGAPLHTTFHLLLELGEFYANYETAEIRSKFFKIAETLAVWEVALYWIIFVFVSAWSLIRWRSIINPVGKLVLVLVRRIRKLILFYTINGYRSFWLYCMWFCPAIWYKLCWWGKSCAELIFFIIFLLLASCSGDYFATVKSSFNISLHIIDSFELVLMMCIEKTLWQLKFGIHCGRLSALCRVK